MQKSTNVIKNSVNETERRKSIKCPECKRTVIYTCGINSGLIYLKCTKCKSEFVYRAKP